MDDLCAKRCEDDIGEDKLAKEVDNLLSKVNKFKNMQSKSTIPVPNEKIKADEMLNNLLMKRKENNEKLKLI